MDWVDDDDHGMGWYNVVYDFFLEQQIIGVKFCLWPLADTEAKGRRLLVCNVCPHKASAPRSSQDFGFRMHRFPFFPAYHPARKYFELGASQGSCHGETSRVIPFGVGERIVNHKRLAVEHSFVTEIEGRLLAVDFNLAAVHHSRLAEGSPANRDRQTADTVVNELVKAHDRDGIGPGFAVERKADHPLVWPHRPIAVGHRSHGWIVQNGEGIFAYGPERASTVLFFKILLRNG